MCVVLCFTFTEFFKLKSSFILLSNSLLVTSVLSNRFIFFADLTRIARFQTVKCYGILGHVLLKKLPSRDLTLVLGK